MEQKQLIIKDQIEIDAPKDKVWEVLTNPEFIKKWDDIPENYTGGHLKPHSIIDWEGYSKLTVTAFEKNYKLKLNMHLPKVDLDTSKYDVNYCYILTENEGRTILNFEIGDFSPLPGSQNYFDASLEWIKEAKQKIKELSEEKQRLIQ